MALTDDLNDPDSRMSLTTRVGILQGKVEANERRFDRHESWTDNKFSTLEGKIDKIDAKIDSKIDGLDVKIDSISDTLSKRDGGHSMLKTLATPAGWFAPAVVSGIIVLLTQLLHLHF